MRAWPYLVSLGLLVALALFDNSAAVVLLVWVPVFVGLAVLADSWLN